MDVQDNGVPFDKSRLDFSQRILSDEIVEASAKLYADSRIGEFENIRKGNSTQVVLCNLEVFYLTS